MLNKSILHVVNIYFVLPYFIGDQFLYFNNKGYKLHVICSQSESLESYAIQKNFSYKEIPILRSFSIFQDIKSIILICKYISKSKIDIVCGHTPKGALLSMISAYVMRVPKRIYFRHGLVYETSFGLKRNFLIFIDQITSKLATQVVCVSASIYKRSLEDKLNSVQKQLILGNGTCNGIDVERFSKTKICKFRLDELRKKLGIPTDAFVIGFTGRLVRDKGIIELINAFNLLLNKYSNIYLLLVGMFEERDTLPMNIINLINNSDKIKNTGYVDNNVIEYYYCLMSIFTLPSYREGFPTSVLEASSMELPVITTKSTGCIDSIIENKTGLFVEHNHISLFRAIERFIIEKSEICDFGKNGRNFVIKNFEQHLIWQKIEMLYNDFE
ncbi:MAG: glycosyltransferase family 4 protein [Patescibacteria group bacterium]